MRLPLPRSRRARLLAGVVVLAAAGGAGAAAGPGGGGAAPEAQAAGASDPARARWRLTVDPAALPEAPVPADAPVVEPEGPDGLLSLEQLGAVDGASLVRDAEGRLRLVHGDWRAEVTTADRVSGLPGVLSVHPVGEDTFLVASDLPPDRLAGLPGVTAVATEAGAPAEALPAEAPGPSAEGTGQPPADDHGGH